MLVVLAVLCPPVAVLFTAPPSHAAKNVALTLFFYVPGVLHARAAVDRYQAHRQYDSLARLLDSRTVAPVPNRAA